MAYEHQIKTIKQDRNKNLADARAIADKAAAEGRQLTAAEDTEINRFHDAIEKQDGQVRAYERLAQADASADANGEHRAAGRPTLENRGAAGKPVKHGTDEYRAAYREFLETGERRAMTMADQPSGGALLAPASVSAEIIRQVDNAVYIKSKAKKYPVTTTQATGVRRKTARMSAATWTTEIGNQPAADSTMTFDRRDLTPQLLTKVALVSTRLLMSGADVEGEVNEELAYQYAIAEENAFLNGNGTGQPLGLFNASNASAISTSRDVVAASATALAGDDLINVKYSMKQGYLNPAEACWIFHRNVVKAIRMLKDSQNRYVWREGLSSDKPDTILDIPFNISEYAPGTIATGNYVGILANLKYYGIAELKDLQIQRLVELYAANNEVGFKGMAWIDGQPLLDEAFARLKMA